MASQPSGSRSGHGPALADYLWVPVLERDVSSVDSALPADLLRLFVQGQQFPVLGQPFRSCRLISPLARHRSTPYIGSYEI